jgi:hypothetical protein
MGIRGRAVFWIGETRAVRCFVVRVAGDEIPAQKTIARRRPSEPPRVVKRERIRPRGVGDLRQARIQVIRVIHGSAIRIVLCCQPVQLVVRTSGAEKSKPAPLKTARDAAPETVSRLHGSATRLEANAQRRSTA